ncbi:MAG: MinD/ParA family protein [Nitrospinota bacterium]
MDQAKTLKRIVKKEMMNSSREGGTLPRVIAVTSGKGGVGKTNVVVNLAFALTRLDKHVLVFDADVGLGNVDIMLGIAPKFNLHHILRREKEISEVIVNGPGGIKILPAASGIQELVELSTEQRLVLSEEFDILSEEFDILLLDTGAGISSNVTYFCTAAQDIIVVALPEPTSITDAYALMKVLSQKHAIKDFRLLVNAVKNEGEGKEVFRQLSVVADRFLPNISIDYLGHILRDENVVKAIRHQRAVLEVYPHSKASQCFMSLSKKICDLPYVHPSGSPQFLWRAILGGEG